jgi:Ca-activated chloride channel family protein
MVEPCDKKGAVITMPNRIKSAFMTAVLAAALLVSSCGRAPAQQPGGLTVPGAGETLTIISGSENKELEPILQKFVETNKINIVMNYMGSLDIMRKLQSADNDYDAVWPASSLWLSIGDTAHRVKHAESVSLTPVVFGIRKSLAEKLGFVGRDVTVGDIRAAIEGGYLSFCMTSATQ